MTIDASSLRRYRPLRFGVTRAVLTEGAGGVRYLKAGQPLEPCALDVGTMACLAEQQVTCFAYLSGQWAHEEDATAGV